MWFAGTKAKVLFSYKACNEDELTLEEGQIIQVTDMKLDDAGWWKGELAGRVGVFPDNFVQLLTDEEPAPPTATGVSFMTTKLYSLSLHYIAQYDD